MPLTVTRHTADRAVTIPLSELDSPTLLRLAGDGLIEAQQELLHRDGGLTKRAKRGLPADVDDATLAYLHTLFDVEGVERFDTAVTALTKGKEGPYGRWKARHLIRWYERGEGAGRVLWGTPGDFDRCVALAGRFMRLDQAKGFCNLRHKGALGFYPATHAAMERGKLPGRRKLKKARRAHLAKVGPKGYVHNWIYVGPNPLIGGEVRHPKYGRGIIIQKTKTRVTAHFNNGEQISFQYKKETPGWEHFTERAEPKPRKTAAKGGYTGPRWKDPPGRAAEIREWRKLVADQSIEEYIPIGMDEASPEYVAEFDRRYRARMRRDELRYHRLPPEVIDHYGQEEMIDRHTEDFRQEYHPEVSMATLKTRMTDHARKVFAEGRVAVRVPPARLERALARGRFTTQHETNRSHGMNDPTTRAQFEQGVWGLPLDLDPKKRPVYGYLLYDEQGPMRVTGGRAGRSGGIEGDALSQYGRVQVVLKPSIRTRTTAMYGDSLSLRQTGRPAPVDNPDWRAFTPHSGWGMSNGEQGLGRNPRDLGFQRFSYVEAQIHGGVTVDDIEEVILPPGATAALKKKLDQAGVKWRALLREGVRQ